MHTVEVGLVDENTQEDLGYLRLLVELRDVVESHEEEDATAVGATTTTTTTATTTTTTTTNVR